MNTTIIRRFLRDRRMSLAIYCFSALAFALLYVALFPSFENQMGSYEEIFKSFPQGVLEAMGINNLDIGDFQSYFGAEHLSMLWPLLAIIMAISYAGRALAGGVESGSVGLELAQPVSRAKLYFSKYLAGLVAMTIFVVVSIMGTVPLTWIFDVHVDVSNWYRLTLLSWFFATAIYSVAYMISAMFSERSRAYGVVSGLLIAMYVARIVASLQEKVDWLRYLSFFYYYDGAGVVTGSMVRGNAMIVFSLTSIVAVVIGYLWWRHRDFSV